MKCPICKKDYEVDEIRLWEEEKRIFRREGDKIIIDFYCHSIDCRSKFGAYKRTGSVELTDNNLIPVNEKKLH